MKKSRIHKERVTTEIKKQILKVIPYAKDIMVNIQKSENGLFQTLIKVHIPHKKSLVAVKSDESLKHSLEKSRQAIFKQIRKIKVKRSHFRSLKLLPTY